MSIRSKITVVMKRIDLPAGIHWRCVAIRGSLGINYPNRSDKPAGFDGASILRAGMEFREIDLVWLEHYAPINVAFEARS